MKAAVCYEFGKPLVIEEVTIDPPQQGEVKIRMEAVAICHSDIHLLQGDYGGTTPVIAGHEAAGIVEEIGDGVTRVKAGDRVAVSLLRSCGHCMYCTTGVPHLCEARWPLDRETRLKTPSGDPIRQGVRVGAFAEYVIVDQSQLVVVDDAMPLEQASLLSCGVVTGIGSVINKAKVEAGSSVVVIGCGGVGLNAIQGANLVGASPIIAVDMLDDKLEAAREFGATHVVKATDDVRQFVRDLTGGRGADYVFVTVGIDKAIEQGTRLIRNAGTLVLVGLPGVQTKVPLSIFPVVYFEHSILGVFMGAARLSVDLPKLMALYQAGKIKLDELITRRYSLDQINEAIADVEAGNALRNVIVF